MFWRRAVWECFYGPFLNQPTTGMTNSAYAKVMWCPLMVKKYGQQQHPWGRGSYGINGFFINPGRRLTQEDLKGKVEPLIMAGTVLGSAPIFGTWEATTRSVYPYNTGWMNLSYEYGYGANSAIGVFLDGHTKIISKGDGVNLNALLSDESNFK
jgi:hypothetical protein